jgi:uncharacterized sodium:solute symporter family permease YidK
MLAPADIAISISLLLLLFGASLWLSLRKKRGNKQQDNDGGNNASSEYFLGGRSLHFIPVGLSLFASNIGAEHFLGLAGAGAARGLAVGYFEWYAAILLVLLGFVFAPLYRRTGIATTPEFAERRFAPSVRSIMALITLVMYVLTKISVTLFSGAVLLKEAADLSVWESSVGIVVVTGIYTAVSADKKKYLYFLDPPPIHL